MSLRINYNKKHTLCLRIKNKATEKIYVSSVTVFIKTWKEKSIKRNMTICDENVFKKDPVKESNSMTLV